MDAYYCRKTETKKWTLKETKCFQEVLADLVANYKVNLVKKALKKPSTKDVFEATCEYFKRQLNNQEFMVKSVNS